MFDKYIRQNAINKKQWRDSALYCIECTEKLAKLYICGACGKHYENWGKRKNLEYHLCKECVDNGYTMMHKETYKCTTCNKTAGYRKFTRSTTFYREQGQLICIDCAKADADKLKILQEKIKTSKMKCKCGFPIHKTKTCPLGSQFASVIRWPGCDVITKAEKKFLDNLKPQPK